MNGHARPCCPPASHCTVASHCEYIEITAHLRDQSLTCLPASVGTPITQPVSQCPSKAADALTGSPFCIYNDRAYNAVIMSLTC